MVNLINLPQMDSKHVENFLIHVANDGTIGMTYDMTAETAYNLLTGSSLNDSLEGSELADDFDEYSALLHGLKLAIIMDTGNIYMCPACQYVSSSAPCDCGKGYGIENVEF